ncbi:MAG: prepilin-type N-terminal cleavage/methylation domain-containing protein [Thermodesulfovibrionales bacterium]|nr:prepilin-type N-terminal cleavage/methylation domain-containing protein [Thermodesulfovibrionales bacterium]
MEKREEKERTLISQTGTFNKGFTLIEIITVIFILSIAIAIVLPSINVERSITYEVKRFAALLRYMLDEAATKKEVLHLTIEIPEKRVIYEIAEGRKEESFNYFTAVRSSSRGDIRDSILTLFFYPTGVKENFIFTFQNRKEKYEVNINPISRRVKIEKINEF